VGVLSKKDEKYWTLPRLYVGRSIAESNISLSSGALVTLSPDQTHYLTNVMRFFKKRKNKSKTVDDNGDDVDTARDCIRIFDGENGEWLAKVEISAQQHRDDSSDGKGRIRKRSRSQKHNKDVSLVARCILQLRTQDDNNERPWVLFAPVKKVPRMKIMIEKCTELGAGRMVPVISDRMEGGALMASFFDSNCDESNLDVIYGGQSSREKDYSFDKLELQAIEAAEQCERLSIPSITGEVPLAVSSNSSRDALWNVQDLVKQWEEGRILSGVDGIGMVGDRTLLICRERASSGVVPVLEALQCNRRVSFLVGPEGGWSLEEEELFDQICSRYGGMEDPPVRCVSLGSSVLRAETASMMAVGAWALVND